MAIARRLDRYTGSDYDVKSDAATVDGFLIEQPEAIRKALGIGLLIAFMLHRASTVTNRRAPRSSA